MFTRSAGKTQKLFVCEGLCEGVGVQWKVKKRQHITATAKGEAFILTRSLTLVLSHILPTSGTSVARL